jgi:hypothetical protein
LAARLRSNPAYRLTRSHHRPTAIEHHLLEQVAMFISPMSALKRITDSGRTASHVRKVSTGNVRNERGRQLRRPYFRAVRVFSIMITSYRSIWLAIIFQLRMRVVSTVASALPCAKGNKLRHSANWARQRSALYMAISFA